MKNNKLELDKGQAALYIELKNGIIYTYNPKGKILLKRRFAYKGTWDELINLLSGGIRRNPITMTNFIFIMENYITPIILIFGFAWLTYQFIIL